MNHGMAVCFLSVFVLFSALLFIRYRHFICNGDELSNKKHDTFTIIIGILSARENFKNRETLRSTWIRLLKQYNGLGSRMRFLHKFIIGSSDCEIPVEDRLNEYTCEWDPYIHTYMDGEIIAYKVRENSQIAFQTESIGLDFEVMHPIVIKKLGILAKDGFEQSQLALRVSIFDTVFKKEVLSAIFNEKDIEAKNGFLFIAVDNVLLPKEFKGTLVVDGDGKDLLVSKSNESCLIDDGGGLIKFKKITRLAVLTGIFPTEVEDSVSFCSLLAGTFTYQPYGMETLKPGYSVSLVNERLTRINVWTRESNKRKDLLEKEIKDKGDIVLFNVKDVYRNIPLKLLQFYKWVDDYGEFKFILKTDDDCYLNILKIIQALESSNWNGKEHTWFGNFRFNWPLDKFGKWAEHEYASSVYPAFACGSGYILSKGVVEWISMNFGYLHPYQGEDVSTGIWLAAINPKLANDKRWSCFKICNNDMFSLPNNKPEELLSLYKNQMLCGNPCGCSA